MIEGARAFQLLGSEGPTLDQAKVRVTYNTDTGSMLDFTDFRTANGRADLLKALKRPLPKQANLSSDFVYVEEPPDLAGSCSEASSSDAKGSSAPLTSNARPPSQFRRE